MANWTTEPQPFGANHVPLLAGVSSVDGHTPVPVAVDPATGSVLTSGGGGGGTQYAEGATTSPGTGNLSIGRYKVTPPSLTDGQLYGLQLDSSGNLKVTGSLSVGGTTDNSAFTAGTSTGTPAMGFYHSTIDTVTDGRSAAVGITSKRAMLVNLQTAAGVETGIAAVPLQVSLANTGANTNKLLVTPDSVALPANQSVNVSQINAVTPLMGNGVTGTGSQWVTIASDNTAFSVNATLSAETTKVIGTVRNADGAGNLWTSNSTTYTAKFGQDSNLLGTLGTAFSTAGKVDVKGADGDVFVRQATASNLNATVVGTGTFVTQSTLAAETTKVIGVTRTADGSGNLLTSTTNALDVNLKTSALTNLSTNVAQMNGVTVTMGNGVAGTGVQRVAIASDNTAFSVNAVQSGTWTTGTTSAVINVGQKTVSTSATQINAASTVPTNGVIVQALSTNTASIFVGGSGVTTATGFELTAGQSMSFTCNLNTLYIISVASTTDKICYNVE